MIFLKVKVRVEKKSNLNLIQSQLYSSKFGLQNNLLLFCNIQHTVQDSMVKLEHA